MRTLHRYAFGMIVLAASCGQILDADGPYRLDPQSTGGSGGDMAGSVAAEVASSSSSSMGAGGMGTGGESTGGTGGSGGALNTCGNGVIEGKEQCDDGNTNDGDGCSASCMHEAICGDGSIDAGEECDDGNMFDGDGCSAGCASEALCGNGDFDPGEQCDDANRVDGDSCDSNCTITACGNGIVTTGEECDDGNKVDGDGCSGNCKTESFCGDGIMNTGEECDDANMVNNDGCTNTCRFTPRSCIALAENCGPAQNENCCTSPTVPPGTFNRINNSGYPATVSSFRLDRFEVTVGRFRKFVEAYPQSKPAGNAGAHPLIPGSGWNDTWNSELPVDQTALRTDLADCSIYTMWSDAAAGKELMPINCMKWYEAFAFCAWDGGRLPTEAEWNYAAAGANEQRNYPWSNPPNSTTITSAYANYNCYGDGSAAQDCKISDILMVGSRSSMGDGRWGHADLGGSMRE